MNLRKETDRDMHVSAAAIHPKFGLAWTDGRGIFLVPVNIIDDEVEYEGSIKLGEFE